MCGIILAEVSRLTGFSPVDLRISRRKEVAAVRDATLRAVKSEGWANHEAAAIFGLYKTVAPVAVRRAAAQRDAFPGLEDFEREVVRFVILGWSPKPGRFYKFSSNFNYDRNFQRNAPKAKPWTAEDVETLLYLFDKGYNAREIARQLGRSPGSVSAKAHNSGRNPSEAPLLSDGVRARILGASARGLGVGAIAVGLRRRTSVIRGVLGLPDKSAEIIDRVLSEASRVTGLSRAVLVGPGGRRDHAISRNAIVQAARANGATILSISVALDRHESNIRRARRDPLRVSQLFAGFQPLVDALSDMGSYGVAPAGSLSLVPPPPVVIDFNSGQPWSSADLELFKKVRRGEVSHLEAAIALGRTPEAVRRRLHQEDTTND